MLIRMRTGVSLDGFAATPDGVPALDAMLGFVPGESYGTREFLEGDVHLLGGPRTLRALTEHGAVDRFEVLVMPVLLGDGVPLFPLATSRRRLRLEGHRGFPD